MDEETKKSLKKVAKETEARLAKSLLAWKYRKEGKKIPDDQEIDFQSKLFTDQAHEIITRRGKKIWHEFKKAYHKSRKEEDPST